MKQIFITGGSSDIGIALIKRYLEKNYKVVAQFYNGRKSFETLVKNNENLKAINIDFSETKNLENSFIEYSEDFSNTDILVNLAAMFEPRAFEKVSASHLLRALKVNLIPGLILTKHIIPGMMEREWGRILNVTSIGIKFGGGSNSFAYSLSKYAMEFLPSDHKHWAAKNILIKNLRLDFVKKRFHDRNPSKDLQKRQSMIPMGRTAETLEVVETIDWLCSEKNTFTTGQTVEMAGGE